MTAADILAYSSQALARTGLQLAWFLGPLLTFALCMHTLSELIRRRAALLCGPHLYQWLTAPGIVAHELGHALFCLLFGHRILAISLFRPGSDGVLGYVKHSWDRGSLYQNIGNFFIGTGPLWFGTALTVLLLWLLPGPPLFTALEQWLASPPPTATPQAWLNVLVNALPALLGQLFVAERLTSWQFWPILYLLFAMGSHICFSPSDLKGALAGLLTGILLLAVVNLATFWLDTDTAALLLPVAPYVLAPALVLLLVLVCNLLLALLLCLLSSGRS